MSVSHRDDSPDSLYTPQDHDHDNEHAPRRRRMWEPSQRRFVHRPGDGFDFRRPVMSTSAAAGDNSVNGRSNIATVIDLTDEDGTEESQGSEGHTTSTANSNAATAGSSRAQRLPRFSRNVIDVPSPGEDDGQREISNRSSSNFVTLPSSRIRPQFSGLRRPARPPSPPADMDDLEFLEARPRSRPQTTSRQLTPAAPPARGPRSVTPYPSNFNQPIDLTEDADEDVVLLNARHTDGVNRDRPAATAGVGTRGLAEQGFGQMGHIANMLREGGANLGGRLMQRLQGFGLDGELRAQQQAFDHFNHNHNQNHIHNPNHHDPHRQHGHRTHLLPHEHRTGAAPRGNLAGLNVPPLGGLPPRAGGIGGMPGMMDYEMTAFDLGLGGNRPPTPKYSPPPDAEKGFTRNPEENEVVVCPNCGDELAMGATDLKQEVWVVKACGHAYCGECATLNRAQPKGKTKKGKAPVTDAGHPQAFKKCVVEGCGKAAVKASMVHVYLGS